MKFLVSTITIYLLCDCSLPYFHFPLNKYGYHIAHTCTTVLLCSLNIDDILIQISVKKIGLWDVRFGQIYYNSCKCSVQETLALPYI